MVGLSRLPPRTALLTSGLVEDTLVTQGMLGESKTREGLGEEGILRVITPGPTVVSTSPPTRTNVSVSLIFLPGKAPAKHYQGLVLQLSFCTPSGKCNNGHSH